MADFNELEVIMHNLSLMQEGTVSYVRITFSDKLEQILLPWMFANPVIVIKWALGTVVSFVIR